MFGWLSFQDEVLLTSVVIYNNTAFLKNRCHLCNMAFLVIDTRAQEGHLLPAFCCAPFTPCCASAPLPGEGQTVYSCSGNKTLINHSN